MSSLNAVSAGAIDTGIIMNCGAGNDYESNPYYDNLLRVRVPKIHGMWKYASYSEDQFIYLSDEALPWVKFTTAAITNQSISTLQYKAQTFSVGDLVNVQWVSDDADEFIVTGIVNKYADGLYEEPLASSIKELVNSSEQWVSVSPTEITTADGDASYSNEPGQIATTTGEGADNTTDYKYIFGNPFSKTSQYRVSCNFPNYSSGSHHSGIDLAGPVGTDIHAIADATVLEAGTGSMTGNYVKLKHTTKVNGKTIYSVYEHLQNLPSVKAGQSVKGTQLVPDTSWEKAYRKDGKNYTKLTKKPSDWPEKCENYYKQTKAQTNSQATTTTVYYIYNKETKSYKAYSTKPSNYNEANGDKTETRRTKLSNAEYEKIKGVKQSGTVIGKRGNTGNSTGPHLHLGISNDPSKMWNSTANWKNYQYNPKTFISF